MVTFYRVMYITAIVIGVILAISAVFLFFRIKVWSIIRELKNTKQEKDIKKLLQNTVLLNPQIQEDLPNIEGYNDLLAYYFKVFKEEEKKREQMQRQLEQGKSKNQKEAVKFPTYHKNLERKFCKGKRKVRYSVEMLGTDILVK